MCTEFKLCITNTVFRLLNKLKCTWMHPLSKSWHLINYVITQQRDISDVRINRVKCGGECSTDLWMLWSKLCLSIKPPCRLNVAKAPQKLNITKLKYCVCTDALRSVIATALSRLIENPPDWYQWTLECLQRKGKQCCPKHIGESQVQTSGLVWWELPNCARPPMS